MFGSEEQAIQSLTMDDVGNDVAMFLSEVCSIIYNYVQQMAISICIFQIRDVSSTEELDTVMSNEQFSTNAVDIMARCGIKSKLTVCMLQFSY